MNIFNFFFLITVYLNFLNLFYLCLLFILIIFSRNLSNCFDVLEQRKMDFIANSQISPGSRIA